MFTKKQNGCNPQDKGLREKEPQADVDKLSIPARKISEAEIGEKAIESVMVARGEYQSKNILRGVNQFNQGQSSNAGMMTVGQQVEVDGKIEEFVSLEILGSFVGELSGEKLIVSRLGNVDAKVTVETLVVEGHLKGEVQVTNRAIIRSTGKFDGQLNFGSIEVEEGGEITGHLKVWTSQFPMPEEDAIDTSGNLSRISTESSDDSSNHDAAQVFRNFPKPEAKAGGLEG